MLWLICCTAALLLVPTYAQNPAPNYVNGGYGLATFQMSTGINITVSVVIAAALAVALIAGYIRIRRQRRAHRAYLRTRAQVLAIAEAEAAAADAEPLENLEPLHVPYLVLMPDAKDLCIAQHSAQAEPAAKEEPASISSGSMDRPRGSRRSAQVEAGRALTAAWLRDYGGVDRIWANHVASSLTSELETRRRRRKKAIPLYVAILQHKTTGDDPDALEFVVHEDVLVNPPQTPVAETPAPESPPPFAFAFLRRWARGRGGAAGPTVNPAPGRSAPAQPGNAAVPPAATGGAAGSADAAPAERVVEMQAPSHGPTYGPVRPGVRGVLPQGAPATQGGLRSGQGEDIV